MEIKFNLVKNYQKGKLNFFTNSGTQVKGTINFIQDYSIKSLTATGKSTNLKNAKKHGYINLFYLLDEKKIFDEYINIQNRKKEKMKNVTKDEDTPATKVLNEHSYLIYKAKPQIQHIYLEDTGFEAIIHIEGSEFVGKGYGSTKDDASNEAALDILNQMPKPKMNNPLSIQTRDYFYKQFFIKEAELIKSEYKKSYEGVPIRLLDDLLFRHWNYDLKLKYPVEPDLPGFDLEGKKTIKITGKQTKGYIVPAYDPDGCITGGQYFPYNFKEDIVWLSSRENLGYPHQLPNDENPLFVWNNNRIFQEKIVYPFNIIKPDFLHEVIGLSTPKRVR